MFRKMRRFKQELGKELTPEHMTGKLVNES